jgi:hypothetical protein
MMDMLERPAAEALPEQQPVPAEAATDEQPAVSLEAAANAETEDSTPIAAEPAPAQAGEIDARAAAERQRLRERIGQSSTLSRGMRDRLAALLEGDASAATSDSQPLVRAADVVALLEEAIPPQLQLDPAALARPEHPAGEAFFTGDPNQMTDDQAERIAREQLAQSPFARS